MFVSRIYTLKSFDWVKNQQQKNCIIVPPRHTLSYEAGTDTKVVLIGSTYLRLSPNPGPQIILTRWPEVSDRRHSVYCMHHESGELALSVCVRVCSGGRVCAWRGCWLSLFVSADSNLGVLVNTPRHRLAPSTHNKVLRLRKPALQTQQTMVLSVTTREDEAEGKLLLASL